MRKKIGFRVALLLLLLTLPLTMFVGAFVLPCQYGETFLGELAEKQRLLHETPGKRLVFVGGSAVAFGIDSRLVEAQLPGYQAVNFGLYAALGTRAMVDLALPELREGDIVVLSPEQSPQSLSLYFHAESYWQAADGHPALLAGMPAEVWPALAAELPYFGIGKLKNLITHELPEPSGVYRKSAFNAHGDVDDPACAQNIMVGGVDPNTPIRFDAIVVDPDFITYCNEFAALAREKGAEVWYRFPPMNAAAAEGDVDSYAQWLQTQLDFPIIGDPNATVLASEWFFDTNFHLNTSGKVVNTRLLVRDLKAMLGDPSSTDIALPSMPELAESLPFLGDDSDAGCFAGEIVDGEAVLTGLTAQAAGKTRLIYPSTWMGCPVVRLSEGVFSGNTDLVEIILQPNVRQIADYAFAGCTSLRTIQLWSDAPTSCIVGQELLWDCSADIFVPEHALGAYRSHYTWANYAGRIQADETGAAQ